MLDDLDNQPAHIRIVARVVASKVQLRHVGLGGRDKNPPQAGKRPVNIKNARSVSPKPAAEPQRQVISSEETPSSDGSKNERQSYGT